MQKKTDKTYFSNVCEAFTRKPCRGSGIIKK